MTTAQYLETINHRYELGNATEHTFRGDLQALIETLCDEIQATNEPKRQKCGAPDYVLTKKKNGVPKGYIEAKDIADKDLAGEKLTGNKEQFDRYKRALNNLIFTDYLEFHFYQNNELIKIIPIAELKNDKIVALPDNFASFERQIKDFVLFNIEPITSPEKLAEMMASKTRLLAEIIEKAVEMDRESQENSELKEQIDAFRKILIKDIDAKTFSDIYAQTIAYGMFAARYHDQSVVTFSRQQAALLIPASNPFLKKLFHYIADEKFDDRIKWVVDDLVEIFLHSNIEQILAFGKNTQTEEPIIHFYETFLSKYDPKLREARGVWYTPSPVVNFMVRAVDDILKTEFDLEKGISDSSKAMKKSMVDGKIVEKEIHKVQILDPATGTGTFLSEIIKHIHQNFDKKQNWSDYVKDHLLPRLNGFELLMASYAMAHLQVDLLLTKTGYQTNAEQRLKIFLTNSLEDSSTQLETEFASWLTEEANEADKIKRDLPVMCVIGNPPYSGESQNKNEWITNLMEAYKKEPEGKARLDERNPKWINDDYVKFLRLGQYFVEKNGFGVVAFINPHGFLDNPTFRGMRWNLLKTYDKIYTLDLHGNSKKKETAPDGSLDVNVFDIMQGVSINFFVKTGKKAKDELGKVYHADLFGKRPFKYDFLNTNTLQSVDYQEIRNVAPNYYFVPKDFDLKEIYDVGFAINELFAINSVGVVTARDNFAIKDSKAEIKEMIEKFLKMEVEKARWVFKLGEDARDWKVNLAQADLRNNYPDDKKFVEISYRPFDTKWTFYTGNSTGFHCMPRYEVMQHFLERENLGLVLEKIMMNKTLPYRDIFISKGIIDGHTVGSASYFLPLYIYPEKPKPAKPLSEEKKAEYAKKLEIAEAKLALAKELFHSFKETLEEYKNTEKSFSKGLEKEFAKIVEDANKEALTQLFDNVIAKFLAKNVDKPLEKLYKKFEKEVQKAQDEVKNFETKLNPVKEISLFAEESRKANFKKEIIEKFAKTLGLTFTNEKQNTEATFAPIDVLDYIYAVLHSPAYREKYKEFLKMDFPRVPYPTDVPIFWKLVALGTQIRQIHLLESPKIHDFQTKYGQEGDNVVRKTSFEGNKVYINETQYFENVAEVAWNFYIGGYQPAQKWLKDRKDRKLEQEDILHYQKIVAALTETDRLMKEVDLVLQIKF